MDIKSSRRGNTMNNRDKREQNVLEKVSGKYVKFIWTE